MVFVKVVSTFLDTEPIGGGGGETQWGVQHGGFRNGKKAGIPLRVCACPNPGSLLSKDLSIGTGAVGQVKPVDLGGCEN
jgi:hypothetical protein